MKTIDLNSNWFFVKKDNPIYIDEKSSEGQEVDLPHTYNAVDGQSGEGLFRGRCWYQKNITISYEDLNKHIFLEIGAASLKSEVYLNGTLINKNSSGFALYRVYLNPQLKTGENLISIMVDNSEDNRVYPLMADFSFYGGIYREVNLITTDSLHFDLLDNSRDGISVTQKKSGNGSYALEIKGRVINEERQEITGIVSIKLKDEEQHVVLEKSREITVKEELEFQLFEEIKNPILWNGLENPYLYTLEVALLKDGNVYDERSIRTGFRTVEITPDKGVVLNGNSIKLNGVSRHQDFDLVGNALRKEHMDLDMELIKEIGANTVRLAHYQHHDYFYSLCDEVGLLVWAEIPFISVPTTSDKSNQNAKDQLERLIKQTQNHTSVYCYGVQNEITIAVENEKIYEMTRELEAMAKDLDPSRYTAQANIYSVDNMSPLNEITDFVGYNLYYGWYYKELSDLGERLDEFHKERPNIPIMVTEYGVDTNPKFHSYDPVVKDYTEEYQLLFHDNALKTFAEREFVLGGYQWNMFDFGSDSRNEGGVKGKNQKGLVTIDRKIKKDAFYLYKAYWSKEPFVKLSGSRFVKRHKKNNDIVVLSNLKNLKLYKNGELIQNLESDEPMTIFKNIEFSEGENFIKAEGLAEDGTTYTDESLFHYQKEKEQSYVHVKKDQKTHVINWFEKYDLTTTEEFVLQDGYYSTFDTIEELYNNMEARQVFIKFFGKMAEHPKFNAMKGIMSIEKMAKISNMGIPKELLPVINKELNKIEKSRVGSY
ncbi:glycoside hydrolase family 2 protein [Peribacillus loiseleuriae]|uniref:glycoside hydrolase family 2 protein n=1 Tax=Peribacillus loiseleuriae TaxID=1679170 RepID=UPI003D062CC8